MPASRAGRTSECWSASALRVTLLAGRSREVQGGLGRSREVQGGSGRSREVQGGLGRSREV